MENIIVSFSGGRTSAFMGRFLKDLYPEKNLIFVFANTGKEREETLEFVNKCDVEFKWDLIWVEYDIIDGNSSFRVVNYKTASRNGEPFEKMISKYGLPNISVPHCSRELKKMTIQRYLRSVGLKNGEYVTAIGKRADEEHRINRNEKFEIYPLCDIIKTDSEFIRNFWDSQPFDLQLLDYQGNCDMCYKKSFRKLMTLNREDSKMIDWWEQMENKYGQSQYTFFRENRNAFDIKEMSKRKFRLAMDNHLVQKLQYDLFDIDLDKEYDCSCKI